MKIRERIQAGLDALEESRTRKRREKAERQLIELIQSLGGSFFPGDTVGQPRHADSWHVFREGDVGSRWRY